LISFFPKTIVFKVFLVEMINPTNRLRLI
jgi:hypothetical protein